MSRLHVQPEPLADLLARRPELAPCPVLAAVIAASKESA